MTNTATVPKMDTPAIYDDLHRKLVTAQFDHGEKLKSEELRHLYGCSANTIREVLFRLSTAGLVAFEEQRGFRARRTSRERQHDLTQFRILLEQEGASLSMKHGDIEWEARLSAAHHKLSHIEGKVRRTGSVENVLPLWSSAEWEFHDTLISACNSPLLRETYKTIYDQFRQQLVSRASNYGYYVDNIEEHRAILEAALARDEALCRQHIHDHLARNMIS
ncbi:GntR family transcriptional regulator [Litoreibacter halocynthiae]|uniref:GntR family transcriptional regulator n=1 Tax=Litoreibacter halocynthiae TaxID=1242689 RepID=A0A4R7LLZ1_9RHOB|nr:GntR family transcriptional regulator [Litoreibacter halocynthiae]TDT77007.1 GntR family transcriptional regulator [Litoreibacter halocynthiae]